MKTSYIVNGKTRTMVEIDGLLTITKADAVTLLTQAATAESAYLEALQAFRTMPVSWTFHKELRAAYVAAIKAAQPDLNADAVAKRWERFCNKANYKAPLSQSPAAVAKRAARQATAKPETVKAPASGEKAAKVVKAELTGIAAHVASLAQRGEWQAILDIAQSELSKQAPM